MNPRRELALAALGCVVAAALVLFAASRTWLVEVVQRPAPLGPLHTPRSGGSLVPALPAMGLVVLAGAGALFATRGLARRAVGLLVLAGGVTATILAAGSLGIDGVTAGWPVLALVGGLLGVAGGVTTAARAAGWPALGSRYDLPDRSVHRGQTPDAPGGDQSARASRVTVESTPDGAPARGNAVAGRDLWDALDRGEDPTR